MDALWMALWIFPVGLLSKSPRRLLENTGTVAVAWAVAVLGTRLLAGWGPMLMGALAGCGAGRLARRWVSPSREVTDGANS